MPKRNKREAGKLVVLNEEELIRQVELRPILYDKSLKGYRKSTLRLHFWKEVSSSIGATVEECRRRWRSLRDAFAKHYKYLNCLEDLAQSKRKKWVFYDHMSFMAPFLDNSYCEIEDTLLADFPDNSDDGHTLVLNEADENVGMSDSVSALQNIEMEEKLSVNCSQSSQTNASDDCQFIANMLQDKKSAQLPPTRLSLNAFIEEPATKDPPPPLVEMPATSSSSVAMCLDSDEKFLMSCAPILRRLTHRKNALARLKIQQILYSIEFESEDR